MIESDEREKRKVRIYVEGRAWDVNDGDHIERCSFCKRLFRIEAKNNGGYRELAGEVIPVCSACYEDIYSLIESGTIQICSFQVLPKKSERG